MNNFGRFTKFLVGSVLFIVLLYAGLQWFVHDQVEEGIQNALNRMPQLDLQYSRLGVGIFDHTVTLDEVVLTQGSKKIFADQVSISNFDEAHTVPHRLRVAVRGLVLPADPTHLGAFAAIPESLAVLELHGDGLVDYTYSPEGKVLHLHELQFKDEKLGQLAVKGDFSNIDLDKIGVESFVGLQLGSGQISFADSGLTNRFLEVYGQDQGMSGEQYRALLVADFEHAASSGDKAAAVYEALASFFARPGKIVARMNPEQPVPWLYLIMGGGLVERVELLDLTVDVVEQGKE